MLSLHYTSMGCADTQESNLRMSILQILTLPFGDICTHSLYHTAIGRLAGHDSFRYNQIII